LQGTAAIRDISDDTLGADPHAEVDPYLQPMTPGRDKLARAIWGLVYILLFRPSPRPLHAWRAFLLRCFGAKLGRNCHVYARARIWAPWNLECEDAAAIADDAVIYNAATVRLGSHAIVSQNAYICTATHDIDDPAFPLTSAAVCIGQYAWICARACVLPGVTVADGAVLGLASVAARDLEAWQVYVGSPAKKVRPRKRGIATPAHVPALT
jgi:putative colanic acid biosynthesis acetyltransferase WcaF